MYKGQWFYFVVPEYISYLRSIKLKVTFLFESESVKVFRFNGSSWDIIVCFVIGGIIDHY